MSRMPTITPKILSDTLARIGAMGDETVQIGHILRQHYGVKIERAALSLHRTIMNFQFAVKNADERNRLELELGKGTAAPRGQPRGGRARERARDVFAGREPR